MNKNNSNTKNKNNKKCRGKAKVKILGEYCTIKSDETEEYINNIASFIDQHLSEIKANNYAMPRNRLFLLGLMNLADDFYNMQDKTRGLKKKVNDLNNKKNNLQKEKKEIRKKYEKMKKNYQDLEEEYNQFLDLVEEKGGLDD